MAAKTELSTKLLLTNRAALRAKYGAGGLAKVDQAVRALIAADRLRGLRTQVVDLAGAALGSARVKDPADPTESKAAVDALVKRHRPEYLLILGSRDVVPYQDLKNKLHDPADPDSDSDRFAYSDLPYACEHGYSQDVTKFLGPTRVVGRLPDLTGAKNPAYLLGVLRHAAAAKSLARPDSAFALSAKVWLKSTKLSVRNLLGAVPTVLSSPTAGPKFSAKQLGEWVHFVNCHGNLSDPTFSGEGPRDHYKDALDARRLAGLRAGCVAAFECCYGAELYDPTGLSSMSIANAYLARGAAGLAASTTIAYGPEEGNANADVLCQQFLDHLLRGASLGRAMLEARLAYARAQSVVDPYDEKTLAQFVLLGDPSWHPFREGPAPKLRAKPAAAAQAAAHAARQQRRVRLMKAGQRLARDCSFTVPTGAKPALALRAMHALERSFGQRFRHMRLFAVHDPGAAQSKLGKSATAMPSAKHVFVATRRTSTSRETRTPRFEGLLAYQVDGALVQIRLESK